MTIPSYYAIIPANVRYCKNLEPSAKLLYGEITALCTQEGYCWATNKFLSDLYGVDARTIRRWLESLRDNKFIRIEMHGESFNTQRRIYLSHVPQNIFTADKNGLGGGKECQGVQDKNVLHSKTSNNTTNIVVGQNPSALDCGKKIIDDKDITKDDVYHYSLAAKTDWKPAEIDSAWLAYQGATTPITDPYKYIAGIIKKKRILSAQKEKDQSCQKTSKNIKNGSKEESVSIKKASSEAVSSEQILGRFVYPPLINSK